MGFGLGDSWDPVPDDAARERWDSIRESADEGDDTGNRRRGCHCRFGTGRDRGLGRQWKTSSGGGVAPKPHTDAGRGSTTRGWCLVWSTSVPCSARKDPSAASLAIPLSPSFPPSARAPIPPIKHAPLTATPRTRWRVPRWDLPSTLLVAGRRRCLRGCETAAWAHN